MQKFLKSFSGIFTTVITGLLIVINILAFILYREIDTLFWVVYCFTNFAILMQIPILYIVIRNNILYTRVIYKTPTIYISLVYLLYQLIIFIVNAIKPSEEVGHIVALSLMPLVVVIVAIFIIELIEYFLRIQNRDINYKNKYIHMLSPLIEEIILDSNDEELKLKLRILYEKLKNATPISNQALKSIDNEIETNIHELRKMYVKNNFNEIYLLIDYTIQLIEERNKLCNRLH